MMYKDMKKGGVNTQKLASAHQKLVTYGLYFVNFVKVVPLQHAYCMWCQYPNLSIYRLRKGLSILNLLVDSDLVWLRLCFGDLALTQFLHQNSK